MGNNRRSEVKTIWADSGWKRVVLRILLSDRSQSVCKHRLDIKETFCHNGVANESLERVDHLRGWICRSDKYRISEGIRSSGFNNAALSTHDPVQAPVMFHKHQWTRRNQT